MDLQFGYQMEFLEACSLGDLDKVQLLLRSGHVDVHFHHRVNGWTALHWAARRGHESIVKVLLQAGFDPEALSKDGRRPVDVALVDSIQQLLLNSEGPHTCETSEMLKTNASETVKQDDGSSERNGDDEEANASRLTRRLSSKTFNKNGASDSFASPVLDSPTTPTKNEVYSYGRRDSLNRTRFLLVRTSYGNGKESFKRVTLPGGGTVEFLKLTIERAMKMGKVAQVVTLPDGIPIETEEQIRNLADSQKVEVVFEPFDDDQAAKGGRKLSLTEKTQSEVKPFSKKGPRLQKKAFSMVEEYLHNSNGTAKLLDENEHERNESNDEHRIELDEQHEEDSNELNSGSESSLSSPLVSESEQVTSFTCSFSASSSHEKVNRVLPEYGRQSYNELKLDVPVENIARNEDVISETNIELQHGHHEEEVKLMEEVSCEYTLTREADAKGSADISLFQLQEPRVNGDVFKQTMSSKAYRVLGHVDEMTVDEEDVKRQEFRRKVTIALAVTAGVLGIGGVVYYLRLKAK